MTWEEQIYRFIADTFITIVKGHTPVKKRFVGNQGPFIN